MLQKSMSNVIFIVFKKQWKPSTWKILNDALIIILLYFILLYIVYYIISIALMIIIIDNYL